MAQICGLWLRFIRLSRAIAFCVQFVACGAMCAPSGLQKHLKPVVYNGHALTIVLRVSAHTTQHFSQMNVAMAQRIRVGWSTASLLHNL